MSTPTSESASRVERSSQIEPPRADATLKQPVPARFRNLSTTVPVQITTHYPDPSMISPDDPNLPKSFTFIHRAGDDQTENTYRTHMFTPGVYNQTSEPAQDIPLRRLPPHSQRTSARYGGHVYPGYDQRYEIPEHLPSDDNRIPDQNSDGQTDIGHAQRLNVPTGNVVRFADNPPPRPSAQLPFPVTQTSAPRSGIRGWWKRMKYDRRTKRHCAIHTLWITLMLALVAAIVFTLLGAKMAIDDAEAKAKAG